MKDLTQKIIQKYIDDGLIEANRHPIFPLTIYNYTRQCQYDKKWDEVTLQCRGLIMDDAGVIIARGFNKFFNFEELENLDEIPLTDQYVYVQEKMDGSLGILFYYADEWHMATRGSFQSVQAIRGMEIVKKKYDLTKFHPTISYICEIIYPENRIVIDYNEERVVFLSAVINGGELNWATANALFHSSGILLEDIVKTEMVGITPNLMTEYKRLNEENKEGFVFRFYPSNFRLKVKFEEYIRLHRILTMVSNLDIWQALRDHNSLETILIDVPDEFDTWVRDWENAIKFAYVMKEIDARTIYAKYLKANMHNKKDSADWIFKNCPKEYQGIVFAIINGKDYSDSIWRMIRPTYQKPWFNQKV